MSQSPSPMDSDADELKQALAAFGEDALELLAEDDDDDYDFSDEIPAEFLETAGSIAEEESQKPAAEERVAEAPATEAPVTEAPVINSQEFQMCGIEDSDSKLLRYTKELVNSIYSGSSMSSQEDQFAESPHNGNRCIVFSVSQQDFAVRLDQALEIIRHPKISELPRTPLWLRGVTNLRGQIVSVIDLKHLMGLPFDESDAREKAIVIHSTEKNITTSLIADRVRGIRSLRELESPNQSSETDSITTVASTVDDEQVLLIDIDQIFESTELTLT